jgi:hypothetical protein
MLNTMSTAITSTRRALLSPTIPRSCCLRISNARSFSKRPRHAERDLFTPSPFAKSDTIPIDEELVAHRELKEDNAYGMRRYLLLPRNELDLYDAATIANGQILASIHANQNMMFGMKLHNQQSSEDTNVSFTDHLNICGPLLDLAKEDASINGQQPQALCALHGLCGWVKDCLENNGEGSKVLDVLMTEYSESNNINNNTLDKEEDSKHSDKSSKETKKIQNPRSRQRIQNKSKAYSIQSESQRLLQLSAVKAIATNTPRPGHSILGMGTYRDGRLPWIHLGWEYTQLSSPWDESCRCGLEELMVYKSRDGEVGAIEHLAHREESYLRSAGGAMARVFFV